jgi:hypothetical protein
MVKDLSKPLRSERDDAHRLGQPKHHTGTSSKRPLEAGRGRHEGPGTRCKIIGRTRGAALKRKISSTGLDKQIQRSLQFFYRLKDRHEIMNR